MMEVTLDQAYREACTALGESVVRERILAAQLSQHAQQAQAPPPAPAADE